MRNGGGEWLIIICGLIIFFAPLIGILRSGRTTMGRTKKIALEESAIRAMFAAKIGDVSYHGAAKRSFYDTQHNTRQVLKLKFALVRSISAMPHREREFLRLYLLMNARGWFDSYTSDCIHFGLVFGNGAASIAQWKYWIPDVAKREMGVNNHVELIRWYAKNSGFSSDAAISELMTVFNRRYAAHPNDPLVREIFAMITSGNCWLSDEDMPNSSFAPNRRHGLFIGVLPADGRPLFHYGEGSLVTIAPPGAGRRSATSFRPAAVEGPGSRTRHQGRTLGQDLCVAAGKCRACLPLRAAASEKSHSFNPLDHIRVHPDYLWEDCMIAAELLMPLLSSKEPFFEQSAQRVLTTVLAYLCYELDEKLRTMQTVLKVISRVGWDAFLKHAADTDYEPLRNAAVSIRETDEKTLSNILAQLQTSLRHWTGPRLARITGKSDWRPGILRSGRNHDLYLRFARKNWTPVCRFCGCSSVSTSAR
jgi:type IV secretion system protein VirD4